MLICVHARHWGKHHTGSKGQMGSDHLHGSRVIQTHKRFCHASGRWLTPSLSCQNLSQPHTYSPSFTSNHVELSNAIPTHQILTSAQLKKRESQRNHYLRGTLTIYHHQKAFDCFTPLSSFLLFSSPYPLLPSTPPLSFHLTLDLFQTLMRIGPVWDGGPFSADVAFHC